MCALSLRIQSVKSKLEHEKATAKKILDPIELIEEQRKHLSRQEFENLFESFLDQKFERIFEQVWNL